MGCLGRRPWTHRLPRSAPHLVAVSALLLIVASWPTLGEPDVLSCGTDTMTPAASDSVALAIEIHFLPVVQAEELKSSLGARSENPTELAHRVLHRICGVTYLVSRCKTLDFSWDDLPVFRGVVELEFQDACSITRFAGFDTTFVTRLENQLLADMDGLGLLPIQSLVAEIFEISDGGYYTEQGADAADADGQEGRSQLTVYQTGLVCLGALLVIFMGAVLVAWWKGCIQLGSGKRPARSSEKRGVEDGTVDLSLSNFGMDPSYGTHHADAYSEHQGSSSSEYQSSHDRNSRHLELSREFQGPSASFSAASRILGTHGSGMSQAPDPPPRGESSSTDRTHRGQFPAMRKNNLSTASASSDGKSRAETRNNSSLMGHLKVNFESLKLEEEIGSGNFKTVYRGKWNGTTVAIVKMRQGGMVTEAQIMQKLGTHPNLVQFYRWARDARGSEYMIMELLQLGSLYKLLSSDHDLSFADKLKICEQICCAMCELCKEGLLHCDLAARNVLVASTEPPHVKVADFGLARAWDGLDADGHHHRLLDCLPLRWTPPEVFREGAWSEKSDVWTFGVTMWEIFTNGEEPFVRELGDADNVDIVRHILDGHHLSQPKECPDQIYCLMTDCWCYEPENRPTFEHLLERFKGIHANFARRPQLFQNTRAASPSTVPSGLSGGLSRPSLTPSHGALLDAVLQRPGSKSTMEGWEAQHGFMVSKYLNSSPPEDLAGLREHGLFTSPSYPKHDAVSLWSSQTGSNPSNSRGGPSQRHVVDSNGYTSIPDLVADAKARKLHEQETAARGSTNQVPSTFPSQAAPGYANIREFVDSQPAAHGYAMIHDPYEDDIDDMVISPAVQQEGGRPVYANIRDLCDIPGPPTEFLPLPGISRTLE